MPETLAITQDGSKIKVEIRKQDGTLIGASVSPFTLDHHYKKSAPLLGLSARDLQRYIDDFRRNGVGSVILNPETPHVFTTRDERSGTRQEYPDFASALADPAQLVEWESAQSACAVDVDFHGGDAPDGLSALACAILPRPSYWWRTRSSGLRLIYLQQGEIHAQDLAGVAAVTVLANYPECRLELLTRTRKPPGEYFKCEPSDDRDALRKLFGNYSASDDDVSQWMDARGLTIGGRYPHTCCPVNPSERAAGNADPVVCHDDHVHCYICAADGVTFGSATPGHFPYGKLCGTAIHSLFRLCVMKFTHWTHARFLLSKVIPNDALAKVVYSAALRYIHGADSRIPLVFTAGDGLVRFDGHWGDESGTPIQFRGGGIPRVLAELPACKYISEDGKIETSLSTAEWLCHTGDITRFGYPAVSPVYGFQVTRFLEPPAHKVPVLLHTLKDESKRPKYTSTRVADAWSELDKVFPGLNRNAIRLLIAAKGCTEGGAGIEPMLFFTGPTGAGKTASVQIAAAICGDNVTTIPYAANDERLRASLLTAKKRGSFATFDEFLKGAKRNRQDPSSAMEILLNFTRDSVSHVLYVGPVAIGALPVCVWCDTTVPREVQEHSQLARRLCHVYFPDHMSWEHSLRDSGVFRPEELRIRASASLLAACDSVVSDVVDEFFGESEPVFADIANALGYRMLCQSDTMEEKRALISRLFALVCSAPALTGRDKDRWVDNGWKLVDLVRDNELAEIWRALADKDQTSSRAIDEMDLRAVLNLKTQARLDVRSHGVKLVVRFISLDGRLCNGELIE